MDLIVCEHRSKGCSFCVICGMSVSSGTNERTAHKTQTTRETTANNNWRTQEVTREKPNRRVPCADTETSQIEKKSSALKILKFHSTGCGPCKKLSQTLKEGQTAIKKSGVTIEEKDVDVYPEIAKTYGITSIPTLVLLRDGVEISRNNGGGNMTVAEVLEWVSEYQ